MFILNSDMNIQHNLQAACKHLNACSLSGCSISINHDLPEPQPLLLIAGGSLDGYGFYLPEGADGIVTFAAGQTMILACPGTNSGFKNTNLGTKPAVATCNSGTKFYVNSVSYNFSNFACKVTLSMLPEHLTIHVTTVQNVIFRSGLKSNHIFINS